MSKFKFINRFMSVITLTLLISLNVKAEDIELYVNYDVFVATNDHFYYALFSFITPSVL